MRSNLLTLTCLTLLLASSCSDSSNSNKDYPLVSIYKEVLVAREMYQDTSIANKKIDSIFTAFGTKEDEFRKKMIALSQEKKDFSRTIDSLRTLVKMEIDSIRREELKKVIE